MVYEFPSDFKRVIDDLSGDLQWSILECIIDNGENIEHGKLRETLKVDEKILLDELFTMQKSGWIMRMSPKGVGIEHDDRMVYRIGNFGKKLLEGGLKSAYRNY